MFDAFKWTCTPLAGRVSSENVLRIMELLGAFNMSTREVKELLLFIRTDRDYLPVCLSAALILSEVYILTPYNYDAGWLAVPQPRSAPTC